MGQRGSSSDVVSALCAVGYGRPAAALGSAYLEHAELVACRAFNVTSSPSARTRPVEGAQARCALGAVQLALHLPRHGASHPLQRLHEQAGLGGPACCGGRGAQGKKLLTNMVLANVTFRHENKGGCGGHMCVIVSKGGRARAGFPSHMSPTENACRRTAQSAHLAIVPYRLPCECGAAPVIPMCRFVTAVVTQQLWGSL